MRPLNSSTYPDPGVYYGTVNGLRCLLYVGVNTLVAVRFVASRKYVSADPKTQTWNVREDVIGYDIPPKERPVLMFDPTSFELAHSD